jgi:hypothetical protein
MNIGGTEFPIALIAVAKVTVVPLSADVALPTWRVPFSATIFEGLWTV